MANTLFPTIEIPSLTKPKRDTDIRYKKSAAWDLKRGDFIRDGAGKIETHPGRDAYLVWCIKTSMTERYARLAYPDSIGAELESAKQMPTREATELALERTIREAITVNPRTEYVRDFTFEWDGDDVKVRFRVKGRNLEEYEVAV